MTNAKHIFEALVSQLDTKHWSRNQHLSCVPWCCCGIAPMVTDDATFHGLSLQLHPQSGLGIFTSDIRITIYFIFPAII